VTSWLGTEKSLTFFYSVLPKSSFYPSFPVPLLNFYWPGQGLFFYPDIMKVTVDDGEQGQKLVLQQS
jgi:hypothetical protein